MIIQLIRTRFESNLTAFLVFLSLNALLLMRVITRSDDPWWQPESRPLVAESTVWLLMASVVASVISLLRYNRERNGRLFAQLPVTSVEVRLSFWAHAGLYLCTSSSVLLVVMLYADTRPLLDMLQVTWLYFSHGVTLLAVISIATSSSLRLIPEEIRRRTIVYFFLATLVVSLILFAIGLAITAYDRASEGRLTTAWPQLTLLMTLLGAGLVALDVQLFRTKDSYIG